MPDTITVTQMCIVWTWVWVMMKGLQHRHYVLMATAVNVNGSGRLSTAFGDAQMYKWMLENLKLFPTSTTASYLS
jgi:hypothetical protein